MSSSLAVQAHLCADEIVGQKVVLHGVETCYIVACLAAPAYKQDFREGNLSAEAQALFVCCSRFWFLYSRGIHRCFCNNTTVSYFYANILTSAVNTGYLGSILIFTSCVVHRSYVFSHFHESKPNV